MMHMDDAVGAALQILSVPRSSLRCNEAYNINAMSFDPQGLFAEIRRHVPGFTAEYAPDFRQDIAAGWPDALNDDMAREDWGWSPKIDLPGLVQSMIEARRIASPVR